MLVVMVSSVTLCLMFQAGRQGRVFGGMSAKEGAA
jgi:hypothetical protein